MNLKSYAWLTVLAMLLALFVPLASAGAQDAEDPQPTGQRAEDGGTLDAIPESATNMVDDAHTITVTVTDDEGEPVENTPVVGVVDDSDRTAESYDGGLPEGAIETCDTDEDGACTLVFNDEEDEYDQPTSGKDQIRVWRDGQGETDDTWEEGVEDYDLVTKTWVDGDDAGETVRLWGDDAENADRIQTANAVSQDHWADADDTTDEREQAQNVVIARADVFPDALAGTPFAVLQEAPLLLTFPDNLDERTEEELQRVLDPDDDGTVYLLGGVHALSQNIEDRIEELGYDVERLFGVDRFGTARDIADEIQEVQGDLNHIFIARSHEFADALAGGSAAANVGNFDAETAEGEVGAILLTWFDRKDADTDAYIEARADATTYALGGPNVNPYSCAVDVEGAPTWHTQSWCANDEDRDDEETADWGIFGADRQETSRAIAEFFFTDPVEVGIARGDKFPDALTGGAHIGQHNGPILLTQTGDLDQDPERYLCYNADTIDTAYIYGGALAVSGETMDKAEDAISGENCFEHLLPGHWVGS